MTNSVNRSRCQAALCVLALLVCVLLIDPQGEMGITDEWSYALTARILADTGHFVYNGWAAPMLGWQGYLGALFIKLFGFSFHILRWSTILVAMATAFLLHRLLVRIGANDWNATVGTLAAVLSPLFLNMACSFMTDMGALFSIVLCLYACVRALQARGTGTAMGWICFAALGNAASGTVRQNAWLGLIFIVPGALWLLRSQRKVLLAGVASWLAGAGFIFYCVKWFQHQPYSYSWSLIAAPITLIALARCAVYFVLFPCLLAFFLVPLLAAFIPMVWRCRESRWAQVATALVLAGVVDAGLYRFRHHAVRFWITPFFTDGSDIKGFIETFLLLSVELLGLMGIWHAIFAERRDRDASPAAPQSITWKQLGVLLVPFTVAYLGSVMPRGLINKMMDRYVLAVLIVLVLVIVKGYQEKVRWRLPGIGLLLVFLMGFYGVARVHDAFSYYRARVTAIDELRAAGVRDEAIDGGFEFDGWVEATHWGYVNQLGIKVPAGAYKPGLPLFAHLKPEYMVTSDPSLYPDRRGFFPVPFSTWIDHGADHKIYVYRAPPGYLPPQD
jgi:hypothetical protein